MLSLSFLSCLSLSLSSLLLVQRDLGFNFRVTDLGFNLNHLGVGLQSERDRDSLEEGGIAIGLSGWGFEKLCLQLALWLKRLFPGVRETETDWKRGNRNWSIRLGL
ncbi:unnamed protein product [Prunus brigantina]